MKKAKWLIFLCVLFCVVCLSACTLNENSIGLSVTVDGEMKAYATVRIDDANIEEYDKGACLEKVTIYYAYTDSQKAALKNNVNYGFDRSVILSDDLGDGKFTFDISEKENHQLRTSFNNYWEKTFEFTLPQAAKGLAVDYLVQLEGKDHYIINSTEHFEQLKCTSKVFTFTAAPPMYTVTIPATVSLGETANVSIDQGENLGSDKYVCVKILGDSDGKFTLAKADDKLAYTISAKYPNDNTSYALNSGALVAYGTSENADTDKSAALTFNKPSDEAVKATKYAGTYSGTVTFGVSIEDDPCITLDKRSVFLYINETVQLKAKVGSLRTDGSVTWSSSDESVATVSSDGIVTGKGKNQSAVITARASNGRTAECKIAVGSKEIIDISKLTGAYQAQNGDKLTGKGNADTHITVADGAVVTIKNCDITAIKNNLSHKWAGITLEGDGTILIEGTNIVKGGYNYPGIFVPEDKTLTIDGSGSLEARTNTSVAGIGGGNRISCGNITINGGTVTTASSGNGAAAIGSGKSSSCGNITISGGIVTATGGPEGAGIGNGMNSFCGNITISGGTVTAYGGNRGAGIGSGYDNSSCGDITIKNTVTQVEATKGQDALYSVGAGKNGSCGTVTIENGANVIQK